MVSIGDLIRFAILHVFGWLLPVFLFALTYVFLDSHGLDPFKTMKRLVASLSTVGCIVVCVFLSGVFAYGSTKGDGGDTKSMLSCVLVPRCVQRPSQVDVITQEDVVRGWRVVASTEVGGFAEMPIGATTNDLLRCRGGFDWAFRVEPEGWRFPYRDGFLNGVTVFAKGEVRPNADTPYFPVPITNGVSLLPEARWGWIPDGGASVFSHVVTADGTLFLNWHNALVDRNLNMPTNLQMELRSDGSFVWRTDGGVSSYLPVFPFDYDGDGLENSVDPEPFIPNAVDAYGTNAEWSRIVCSNVFEVGDGVLDWREDVNTQAYYFIDVVAGEGPAPIYFNADRASCLGSPIVVALAGETNHIPLLIGVEYSVSSTVPIVVSFPENGFAEVNQLDKRSYIVKWPLEFEFVPNASGVYTVNLYPTNPGGTFTWDSCASSGGEALSLFSTTPSSFCSCWFGCGPWVSFSCSETCSSCNGDCKATGEYFFEGLRFSVTGGVCRCGFNDSTPEETPSTEPTAGPFLSINFSKSVIIFEDAYDDSSEVHKPKRSTRARLTISACGGPKGGTLILAPQNLDKLEKVTEGSIEIPSSKTLDAGESFNLTCVYEGDLASECVHDILVAGYLIENGGGMQNASASLTAVKVTISPIVSVDGFPNRHQWGVGERFYCEWTPACPGFQVLACNGCKNEKSYSLREDFLCPMESATDIIRVQCLTERYTPSTQVLLPSYIEARDGEELSFPVAVGYPGGVGFSMDLHVMPDTVSFSALEFIEQSSEESVVEGYFLNPNLSVLWYHDVDRGAGIWRSIQNGNFWFRDEATMGDQLPLPCSRGRIVWSIPVDWREREENDFSPRRLSVVPQVFTMSGDGTLRVSKYRYWTERSIFGVRRRSEGVR